TAGPGDLRIELALADDPADGGVAGDPAHCLGGDDGATVQLAAWRTRRTSQRVDAGPDDQVRPRPGAVRRARGSWLAVLGPPVGPVLPRRAVVVFSRRPVAADRVPNDGPRLGIEQSVEPDDAVERPADSQVAPLVRPVRLGQGSLGIDPMFEGLC